MTWIYPSASHFVTCGFFCYADHNAVDLNAIYEPVWASRSGSVVYLTNATSGRAGRYIEIRHSDGTLSRYMHLSRIDVTRGQQVVQGQQIGVSGASGFSSENGYAPHLHFAIHYPTFETAIAVWHSPRATYASMWAVDPEYVIQHQEEEDMANLYVVTSENIFDFRAVAWSPGAGLRYLAGAELNAAEKASVPQVTARIPAQAYQEAQDRVDRLERALLA